MMQVKYGTYAWPAGGVKVTSTRSIEKNAADVPYQFVDAIECDGYIEAAGQNLLTAAENAMKEALKLNFQDLLFVCDDGSNSATCLTNATSITGVRITDGPHFQDVNGPEYVSQRHFKFKAEADYRYAGVGPTTIIEWSETLAFSGGGPLYVCKPAIEGPAQRQLVYPFTPQRVKQTGYAIGFGGTGAVAFPEPAPPIWPFALVSNPDAKKTHPKRRGNVYTDWRLDWEYSYEWTDVLVGTPTLWRG